MKHKGFVCGSIWTFFTGLPPKIDKEAIYDGCRSENAL